MALDMKNLVQLAKTVAKADPSAPVSYSFNGENFSYDALNETLRREFNELAGTYSLYRDNKNLIFKVIEETLDEVLPKKVEQTYMQFAETKQFAQGDKPISVVRETFVLALSSSSLVLDWQVFTKSSSWVPVKKRASKSALAPSAEPLRSASRSSWMVVLTSQK